MEEEDRFGVQEDAVDVLVRAGRALRAAGGVGDNMNLFDQQP